VSFGSIYPAQKFDKADLVKADLAATAHMALGLLCLEPGQKQAPHAHDAADKVYYVVEGVATITVGKETHELGPGAFAVAKAGETHGLANKGRDRLTVVSVSSPPHPAKK
jgi:mannose-6-phosphate isomerase-like protein (cupin superfamily)